FIGNLACTNSPATAGPNVGSTTTVPNVTGTVGNFTITPVNGSYVITRKQASATPIDNGGPFNGSPYTGSGTCSDSLTAVITYTPGPGAPVNAGTTSFTVT